MRDTKKTNDKVTRPKGAFARMADRFRALWNRYFFWCLKLVLKGIAVLALLAILLVVTFRFANPYLTYYYVSERFRLGDIKRDWTPIETFSPSMASAVVAAEDANFCTHFGFDLEAIQQAWSGKGRLRGASTLSQQVAKNVFLWQERSWIRKGSEAGFTLLIEALWPKRRIVEVYLNVAEFDEGVFGAAAAGRHYFGVEPENLTDLQAARLAAVLPSPKTRSASKPTPYLRRRTAAILSGAELINQDGRADCFR